MTSKEAQKRSSSLTCPCGGGQLTSCCGRIIEGGAIAQTALELMRSRYTAYTLQDEPYLEATWYGSTRPTGSLLDESERIKWLSLEICAHHEEGSDASVEFIARYKIQGRAHQLHEISRFVREDGRWFYLDGSFPPDSK